MKIPVTGCIVVLCLVVTTGVFAQATANNVNNNNTILSFETMHVHFDKDIYLPGETIWFKAYLYNVNEVSLAATNFYAAIYDEKGKLIHQKQYPILAGSCNGDFEIPDTIESSRIQFRAFTKAMIMDDSNNVYEKILTVYNKKNNTENHATSKSRQLQFFPEGGQIIAELRNEIAFKATNADGTPARIKGEIIEVERDKTVKEFATDDMGLGTFVFVPIPGRTYHAVWQGETGAQQETMLPEISRYGVSFHTEIIDRELQYTIARNKTNDSLSVLHLLAQMGNLQVYKANLVIKDEMELSTAKFSISSVPTGLMQLTLFDKDWNKLQERLMFINNTENKELIAVKRDTISTVAKGKNTITITLNDSMIADMSISIADINFYDQPNTHSIQQDLLLNTQLKELNQNASPFLTTDTNAVINLVTLAHQWKRYNWQKLVNKEQTKTVPADDYIALSIVYKEKNFALPKDDALNLVVTSSTQPKQFVNLKPSNQTTFNKTGLIFFDSAKIFYQMDKNKELVNYLSIKRDNGLNIPLSVNALPDKINFQPVKSVALPKNNIENFVHYDTGTFNGVKTIKEVVVKSTYKGNPVLERLDELDKFYTSGMFSGAKGYQLNVIDDTLGVATNNDVQDYLRFRIPGLTLYDGSFKVKRPDISGKFVYLPVQIFIDEMDMTPDTTSVNTGNALMGLNLSGIAYVKYIPGLVIGAGFNSISGALYIYTKTGKEKQPPAKGLPFVYIKGYTLPKEFISPDYSNKTLLKQPDLRSTVYWNPNVMMDKANNTIKIDYYNNDVSKKFLLKIEGVNAAGRLICIEKIIE